MIYDGELLYVHKNLKNTICFKRLENGIIFSTKPLDDGMCESHVNDAIRSKLSIKKVSSSHKKEETVIISENELTSAMINSALEGSGYNVTEFSCMPYEKKGFFSRK